MLIEMANILGYPLLVQQLAQSFEDILTKSELTIFTNLRNSKFFSQVSSSRLSIKHLLKRRLVSSSLAILGIVWQKNKS